MRCPAAPCFAMYLRIICLFIALCSSILQAEAPVVLAVLVKTGVFGLQVKAIKLLVDHHEEILPSAVVPALQACCNAQLA